MSAEVVVVGSFVQDLAFKVGAFPAPGETRIGTFIMGPGGKGSNQAVACHRQGVSTTFIGAVGADIFGSGYREWATREGLAINLLTLETVPTGAASIVVNERAENTIVVALGANDHLSSQHVIASLEAEPSAQVCILQAESNLQAASVALSYVRQRGIFSIFNPAPINPGITIDLLELADCVTPNETECAFLLEHLCGRHVEGDLAALSDCELRALFATFPVSTILLTVGSKGAIVYQRGEPCARISGVCKGDVLRFPALEVQPIDTTGAGDAFNGGLAAGLVRFNGDLPRAVRFATVVAGLSTQSEGTAPSMPSRIMVEAHAGFFS
jgi:ribokinase